MAFEFWVFSPSLVSPKKALASGRERPKQKKKTKTQWHGCMIVGKSFSLYLLCSPLPYNGVRDTTLIGYGEDPKKSNT